MTHSYCREHGPSPDGFTGCPWCQMDAYASKHASLKAENQYLKELLREVCGNSLPLAGTVEDDKIVWRGVDSPEKSD